MKPFCMYSGATSSTIYLWLLQQGVTIITVGVFGASAQHGQHGPTEAAGVVGSDGEAWGPLGVGRNCGLPSRPGHGGRDRRLSQANQRSDAPPLPYTPTHPHPPTHLQHTPTWREAFSREVARHREEFTKQHSHLYATDGTMVGTFQRIDIPM